MEGVENGRQLAREIVKQITEEVVFEKPDNWILSINEGMQGLVDMDLIKSFTPPTIVVKDGNFSGSVTFRPIETASFVTFNVEVERKGITFDELEGDL